MVKNIDHSRWKSYDLNYAKDHEKKIQTHKKNLTEYWGFINLNQMVKYLKLVVTPENFVIC